MIEKNWVYAKERDRCRNHHSACACREFAFQGAYFALKAIKYRVEMFERSRDSHQVFCIKHLTESALSWLGPPIGKEINQ